RRARSPHAAGGGGARHRAPRRSSYDLPRGRRAAGAAGPALRARREPVRASRARAPGDRRAGRGTSPPHRRRGGCAGRPRTGAAPELLALPTDFRRPATQPFDGDYLDVELDEHLTAGLRALSWRRRATLFTTVLAAWGLVLSRVSGQTDVVVGFTTANRRRRE